ncbi:MAG: hypothetical protein QXG65_03885 [Thermoplasmata archaeon]
MAHDPPSPMPADPGAVEAQRESRWFGQEYADMTKLREISAKHAHTAAKAEARAARLLTAADKHRHAATIYREKAAATRGDIPPLQESITQVNGQIAEAAKRATPGMPPSADVTGLQVRARKLQQRAADLERKATSYDLKAARHTQKASEIKVRADHLLEMAKAHEAEALAYRQRADQLQMAAANRLRSPTDSSPGGAPPTSPQ